MNLSLILNIQLNTLLLSILLAIKTAVGQFVYLNPAPGSNYRNPETTITLRLGQNFEAGSLRNANLFAISGSKSGRKQFSVTLSSDQQTIVLMPGSPFEFDEEVTVRVNNGIKTTSGEDLEGFSFSFHTHRKYSIDELQKMEELRQNAIQNKDQNLKPGVGPVAYSMFVDEKNAYPGSTFFATKHNLLPDLDKFICILNNDSSFSLARNVAVDGADFKINKNGYLTYYSPPTNQFYMIDSNYNFIDSFKCKNGYESEISNHEFLIFPDGRKILLIDHIEMVDMSQLVPGGYPQAMVEFSIIQEQDSDDNVIFEWASWDHFNITDATYDVSMTAAEIDPFHVNAVEPDIDGNLLISSRNLDEITKIDHQTGNIIWRMGGKNSQFLFLNDTLVPPFTHQHDIRRIANGNVTLFDNGNLRTPQISHAKEYLLDEINKTATLTWDYKHPAINGIEVCGLASGNVQRLPNGNTLVNYGLLSNFSVGLPNVTEVTSAGDIAWEVQFTEDQTFSYRVYKFPWSPCSRPTSYTLHAKSINPSVELLSWGRGNGAISYNVQYRLVGSSLWKSEKSIKSNKSIRNLLPDTSYEWRVNSICAHNVTSGYTGIQTFHTTPLKLAEDEAKNLMLEFYPNPTTGNVFVQFKSNQQRTVSFSLTNSIGVVFYRSPMVAAEGWNHFSLDFENVPNGVYWLWLNTADKNIATKLCIQ